MNKRKKQNSNPRPGTVTEMAPKIAQTPLYDKKKISKVPFVGTLNLYLVTPDTLQKMKNWSDHPGLRKRPKTVKILFAMCSYDQMWPENVRGQFFFKFYAYKGGATVGGVGNVMFFAIRCKIISGWVVVLIIYKHYTRKKMCQ